MCWNAEVSLNTFIYGLIAAVIVACINTIPIINVLIVLSITLMQLYEYFAWTNIHDEKKIYYLSWFGPLIIILQLLLINYAFLEGIERIIAIIFIFILTIIGYWYIYTNNKLYMKRGENGHLIWGWADVPEILLILILFLYLYPASIKENKIPLVFGIVSISISMYNYYKWKTWGSMWCYYCNLLWLGLIIKSLTLLKHVRVS
jgi:hypothetical protein